MNHPTSRKHPQFLDLAVTVGVAIRKRESQSKGMTRSPAMREFLKFTYGVKDRTSWFSLGCSWFDERFLTRVLLSFRGGQRSLARS